MRFIKTSHYRLVNFASALIAMLALINDAVLSPGFFPGYKRYVLCALGVILLGCLIFVRSSEEVGPLKMPSLSMLQLRLVSGVLLVVSLLSFANYRFLEPGLFFPYKKQVMVGAFVLMGIFLVLYLPQFDRFADEAKRSRNKTDDT